MISTNIKISYLIHLRSYSFSQLLKQTQANLKSQQNQLLSHPIYNSIKSDQQVRIFMENHVFAVFDFMTLLKGLQRELTCVNLPWTPKRNGDIARFINEIVVAEESDHVLGVTLSHYEMYLKSMEEVGADIQVAESFVNSLAKKDYKTALREIKSDRVSENTKIFLDNTLQLCQQGKIHEIASSFFFGREDPIPLMFQRILDNFNMRNLKYPWLQVYLQRHVEIDSGEHGPLAEQLICSLCQDDHQKWKEVENAALQAIKSRILLWDGIMEKLQ